LSSYLVSFETALEKEEKRYQYQYLIPEKCPDAGKRKSLSLFWRRVTDQDEEYPAISAIIPATATITSKLNLFRRIPVQEAYQELRSRKMLPVCLTGLPYHGR